MQTLSIIRPDDWHIHLRDGEVLQTTVPHVAKQFARAIVMPNLKPPVTSAKAAMDYRERILKFVPANMQFEPLMTLYLTEQISPSEIQLAAEKKLIAACKLYPAGATTNSDAGVRSVENIFPVLSAMEKHQLPLLIHGEVTDPSVDVFDREKYFIDKILISLIKQFPALPIVLEHITTKEAADFITENSSKLAATITAHHLLLNRNDLFTGGLRPHHYCLPILKRRTHQEALIKAATSGNPKFFLGTDSAPHAKSTKENSCGCAGIYTAHAAIELYAEIFEQHHALDKLEGFASHFGADFYKLPCNTTRITLKKTEWEVPANFNFGNDVLIPFRAQTKIKWSLTDGTTN